ncbi:hypothetical protein AAFN46_01980 [Pseudomonas sp. CAU 1711]|uniref:hypothetical protein n=1 Tax=Pseudomonas sp. CAU 1711 TaxID=3140356 RepID=UPI003260ABAE
MTALIGSPAAHAASYACPIPGELVQWQADYCLFVSATDDLIAAQPCIDKEQSRAFLDSCSAKRHYKRLLCEANIEAGVRSDSVDSCIADPAFSGKVVSRSGV